MGQAILRVDFKNKKLIPNQQNNSDFYKKNTYKQRVTEVFYYLVGVIKSSEIPIK